MTMKTGGKLHASCPAFLAVTTLASLVAAILNANNRFTLAALATLALNLVMIPVLFVVLGGGIEPPQAAKTLALAVSVGGLVHLALVVTASSRGRRAGRG